MRVCYLLFGIVMWNATMHCGLCTKPLSAVYAVQNEVCQYGIQGVSHKS